MRFIRLVAIYWLLMIAMIGGAVLYGRSHAQPTKLQTLGFGVCGGSPCWHNVVPGVSQWDEIKTVMTGYGLTTDTVAFLSTEVSNSVISTYLGEGNRVEVVTMELLNRQDKQAIPLSAVIALFGKPCRVIERDATGEYEFQFPSWVIAYSAIDDSRLSLDSRVHTLILMNQKQPVNPYSTICDRGSYTGTQWWGFASLDYYQSKGSSE